MPRLLDLFCGAGGAAMGYHRAGFDEIVGVDNKPMPRYPFHFVQSDALEYVAQHGREFDAVHASPPCQGYSVMRHLPWLRDKEYPLLIAPIRGLLIETGKPWVMENVKGAPMEAGWLCGLMFNLKVFRHRLFESSFLWLAPCHPPHAGLYIRQHGTLGDRARDMVVKPRGTLHYQGYGNPTGMCGVGGHNFHLPTASEAMGIPWMKREELTQAIPPAYTEYIGKELLKVVNHA